MRMRRWARLLPAAALLLAGCGDFWEAPGGNGSSFTLSNSGNITVSPGATTGNTATITVTPVSTFTGTVTLSCAVTAPTGASNPATCSLSSSSLTFSSATPQSSTLTATTSSSTTTGAYQFTVTGASSGNVAESTTVCVEVGTGTCTTASSSGNFYILNSSTLAGYYINAGKLTSVSGSSYTIPGSSAVAIGPTGSNYLFVASTSGIIPFTINSSTGALTQGTAFGDTLGQAIQVDPSGKWLLDASDAGTLYAYPITSTGALDTNRTIQANISLASTTVFPGGIAISPSGSTNPYVVVALGTNGTQVFPFNSNNASPLGSAYSPTIAPYGTNSVAVAFDPSNRFLYVGETNAFTSATGDSGALRVFAINASSVKEITYSSGAPTTPYASGGTTPHAILASSNGYVYVANWEGASAGNVTAFLLNASTPSLTLQSNTVSTGIEPYGMAVDSTGDFVLVVNNQGSSPLSAFTFDATTTGQLDTSSVTGSLGANPVAIVAAP